MSLSERERNRESVRIRNAKLYNYINFCQNTVKSHGHIEQTWKWSLKCLCLLFMLCYNALWKITHFEKKFQSALIWGILTHFEKNIENHILYGWLYFSCLKISNIIINLENASISSNVLMTILSIVRSIVMGLKNYCWDKSGFASCKLNQFLQTRFCQSFSHKRKLFQVVELSWIY